MGRESKIEMVLGREAWCGLGGNSRCWFLVDEVGRDACCSEPRDWIGLEMEFESLKCFVRLSEMGLSVWIEVYGRDNVDLFSM